MTRRDLLLLAARAYGVSFAYGLMEEMGMVVKPRPTDLDSLRGEARHKASVVILGAGIGGMCAAYELEQLGFKCVLLEARHRTGGRCYTIRGGDTVEESGPTQVCQFEKGAYFNPGPTRIPYWHSTLDYCRKFGVAVAPWINVNEGAYVYQTAGRLKGQRVRLRDVIADTTGYMAEIVSKSLTAGQAGLTLTDEEKRQALTYLNRFGFLDRDGKYRGRGRRSFSAFHGAGPLDNEYAEPMAFADLFGAGMGGYFHFIDANDQQMSMLEIVGGVDGIARGFERHLRSPIRFGSEVTEIKLGSTGVDIAYKDAHGAARHIAADYCICTIPLPVLRKIPANFDTPAQEMIAAAFYANSTKVASEYKRRFWEEDDQIYGGISWTDQPIGQVIYPCHELFSKSGVLINYTAGPNGARLGVMPPDKRIAAALEMTDLIHPQARQEFVCAVTLTWNKVPFNEGAFAFWEMGPGGEASYQELCKPQGRLYFAGEHASRMTAWMAGAIESARYVVKEIAVAAQAA